MKKRTILFLPAVLLLLCLGSEACSKGDYLGPAERTMRSLTRDWDMWFTPVVRPYRPPLLNSVPGNVSVNGKIFYEKALTELNALPAAQRSTMAVRSYRRFCYHCHGPNGDGRIIVGESFDLRLPDLRQPATRQKSDPMLFQQVLQGSANMIPLADTVPPVEVLLALAHIRSLGQAPSNAFYSPQHTDPIR